MISAVPIFATEDLPQTLEFYRTALGFHIDWTWGEPATVASASCGGVTIMFSLQPDLARRVAGHQHWIKVEDADASFEEHLTRGAKIVDPIEDRPWGVREYVIEDPSGYRLRFAGPPAGERKKSYPFPEGVRLERRLPTEAEFLTVTKAAFGNEHDSQLLTLAANGVVAISPDGEPIALLRIVHDATGWYSIWDVAVLPEWQGKQVGTALMKEALSLIREASPGALVYLFTFKQAFYERLGFAKETVSLVRV